MRVLFYVYTVVSFLAAHLLLRHATNQLLNAALSLCTGLGLIASFGVWRGRPWARVPGIVALLPWVCLPFILVVGAMLRQPDAQSTKQVTPVAVFIVMIPPFLWGAVAVRLLIWLKRFELNATSQ
jgi:uncharacterized membrane protein (DUF2068 family)